MDPMAAVCKKLVPFFQLTGWERKDGQGTRINNYSLRGEYVQLYRRLFCCSVPWHLSGSQGRQKSPLDYVFLSTLLRCVARNVTQCIMTI